MTTPRQRGPAPAVVDPIRHHHPSSGDRSSSTNARRSRTRGVSDADATSPKYVRGTGDSVLLRGVATRADYFGGQPDVTHHEPHSAPADYSGKQYLLNMQGDSRYNPKSNHKKNRSTPKKYSTLPLPLAGSGVSSPTEVDSRNAATTAATSDPNTENLLPLSVCPIPEHREVYSRSPSRELARGPLYDGDDDVGIERGLPPKPHKRGQIRSPGASCYARVD